MTQRTANEDQLWAAVADPNRRRLLDLLAAGVTTATALSETMPITRQAVAKHLAVLDRVGLVDARRHGREVRYAVRVDRLVAARASMAKVAREWDTRLAKIKQLAEAAAQAEAVALVSATARAASGKSGSRKGDVR